MTSSRIRKTFHLKKTNLVETACEDVDDMTIEGYSFRKIVVKLYVLALDQHLDYSKFTFRAFL